MVNPFHYGGVVGADAFCNRQQEREDLRKAAANGERVFIYAERRLGKTSLIKRVLADLPRSEYLPIYIDLWPTDGQPSFVTTVAKALTEAAASRSEKMLETARDLFTHLKPSLTLTDAGNPSIQFGMTRGRDESPELDEVLSAPARIADKTKRRVVVVYDEFQRLLEYETDTVERSLRSAVQQHEGVAYLFLGSRKHLIQRMFLDSRRPLYRSAGHYPLGPIDTVHWRPFIRERFETGDKLIDDALIDKLCEMTEGHPFYTQHLAHALFERTPMGGFVTGELIDEAVTILLERENYAYTTLWESLTRNHQRFLRGLALEPPGAKPFSADFVQTYELRAASNAQRAADSLLDRDIIDRESGSFIITDRFLRLWIRRQ
ncbi:MAG: ATP-binding protein [Rhodothermales bacterium]